MRFKIDENLPVECAGLLTQAGYDAVTVASQRLQGQPDPVIVDTCVREERVLITLDLGFADIRAYPPRQYPGFLVLRVKQQDKKHLIRVFQRAVPMLKQEALEGRLWIIEETQIRIRGEEAEPPGRGQFQ